MNIEEIAKSIYPMPSFVGWTPSEYDMKYRFNTPRKMKYMNVVKEREEAKLKNVFDKQLAHYNNTFENLKKISNLPPKIATLFEQTIVGQLNYYDSLVQKVKALDEDLKKKYDIVADEDVGKAYSIHYTPYRIINSIYKYYIKKQLNPETHDYDYVVDDRTYSECPALHKVDIKQLYFDAKEFVENNAALLHLVSKKNVLVNCILHIGRIIDNMKTIFEGYPTSCLTDPHWGVGGHFNGILEGNGHRCSFKSFIAGGYKIQCLHIRFKMTELRQ